MPIWEYKLSVMARAATTSDVFNAVAEPRRRQILTLLGHGERSVNELARVMRVRQPQASKHLRVLRQVGLVRTRGEGQQRFYALDDAGLQPLHDFLMEFARFRSESFDRLDTYLQELQQKGKGHDRRTK
jgi:DNA-binding transcriptional ArsR family regulator